jgi:uncharacterized membrane protein YphA (DoxX/SURF4 family)
MRILRIAVWALIVLLSLVFLRAGVTKFTTPAWETRFAAWGYPAGAHVVVGILEIGCAALLWVPRTRRLAALLLVAIMIGAALTHLAHGEAPRVGVNAALAGLLIAIYSLSPGATKTEH